MTPRRKKVELWHFSAHDYGSTVEVREREAGGMLYVRYWDPAEKKQVYVSLRHRDREKAKAFAREQADLIKQGKAPAGAITVAELLRLYLVHRTPEKKSAKGRTEDHRRASMFAKLWGAKLCTDVTVADWNAFEAKRLEGAIDAHGAAVPPARREPTGAPAVAHDGRFIRSVFYWGLAWVQPGGEPLLVRNPFGAPAKRGEVGVRAPEEHAPRRPVISDARFQKVREAAERVMMGARKGEPGAELVTVGTKRHGPRKTESPNHRYMKRSYLGEMLDLAWWTGRRRDAIRTLRYSDLVREGGEVVAIGGARRSTPSRRRRCRWRPPHARP